MKRLFTSVRDGHILEDSRYAWVKGDAEMVNLRTNGLDIHSSMDLHIGHYGVEDRTDRQDSRDGFHSDLLMGHHEMVHGQEEERSDRAGRSSRVGESDDGTRELDYSHDVGIRSSRQHE